MSSGTVSATLGKEKRVSKKWWGLEISAQINSDRILRGEKMPNCIVTVKNISSKPKQFLLGVTLKSNGSFSEGGKAFIVELAPGETKTYEISDLDTQKVDKGSDVIVVRVKRELSAAAKIYNTIMTILTIVLVIVLIVFGLRGRAGLLLSYIKISSYKDLEVKFKRVKPKQP